MATKKASKKPARKTPQTQGSEAAPAKKAKSKGDKPKELSALNAATSPPTNRPRRSALRA